MGLVLVMWGACRPWNDSDDSAQLRARAEATERQQTVRAERIGRRWQREIQREQARKRRGGSG